MLDHDLLFRVQSGPGQGSETIAHQFQIVVRGNLGVTQGHGADKAGVQQSQAHSDAPLREYVDPAYSFPAAASHLPTIWPSSNFAARNAATGAPLLTGRILKVTRAPAGNVPGRMPC